MGLSTSFVHHGDQNAATKSQADTTPPRQDGQPFGADAIALPLEARVEADTDTFVGIPDAIGNTYFVGLIRNTGEKTVSSPRVEVRLNSGTGETVAMGYGYAPVRALYPGQEIPVKVLVKDTPDYEIAKVSVTWSDEPFPVPRFAMHFEDARLSPGKFGDYRVSGRVTNDGQGVATYVRIVALLRGKSGDIVGMGEGFLAAKRLAAGETLPFAVSVRPVRGVPKSFGLYYSHGVE